MKWLYILGVWAMLPMAFSYAQMPDVELQSFDETTFLFPADVQGKPVSLVFLVISTSKDNAQQQLDSVIDWQERINDDDSITARVASYHFSVMEDPPFFVKALIRKSIAERYQPIVSISQSGIIYVEDIELFAKKLDLDIDGRHAVLILDENNKTLGVIRSEVDSKSMQQLKMLLHASRQAD